MHGPELRCACARLSSVSPSVLLRTFIFFLSRYNHLLKSSAALIRHLHGSPFRDMSFALAKDAPYRTLTASVLRSFCYHHLYVLLCSWTAAVGGRLEAAKNRHGSNPNPMPFSFLPSGTEEKKLLNMSQASQWILGGHPLCIPPAPL